MSGDEISTKIEGDVPFTPIGTLVVLKKSSLVAAIPLALALAACTPAAEPETVIERVTERVIVPDPARSEVQEEVQRSNAAAERAIEEQQDQLDELERQARVAECLAERREGATRDDGTINPQVATAIEMTCGEMGSGAN